MLVGLNSLWLLEAVPGALTPQNVGGLAALAALGALLPDLDAASSKIASLSLGGVRPLAPLALALHRTLGHRGLLHSPAGGLGLGAGCLFLALWRPSEAPLALFMGYGSHLAADACTKSGVPAWPNRRDRRWHLLPPRLRLTTGSWAEEALTPLLALPALALLLRFLP
ncbi:MAG: metal-dependent hydrolase [Armatimonadetes bacterium]|nr:metal-dependent hydrolase [Armatimonadota bacterium]